jgi:integrase
MRRGEILKLRALDIDFDGNRLLLPQTRNGDGRIAYLNRIAKAALESAMPQDDPAKESLKACALTYVTQTFRRACKMSG